MTADSEGRVALFIIVKQVCRLANDDEDVSLTRSPCFTGLIGFSTGGICFIENRRFLAILDNLGTNLGVGEPLRPPRPHEIDDIAAIRQFRQFDDANLPRPMLKEYRRNFAHMAPADIIVIREQADDESAEFFTEVIKELQCAARVRRACWLVVVHISGQF
jgi:hypothetical protein